VGSRPRQSGPALVWRSRATEAQNGRFRSARALTSKSLKASETVRSRIMAANIRRAHLVMHAKNDVGEVGEIQAP
jgi:hypothetical protein